MQVKQTKTVNAVSGTLEHKRIAEMFPQFAKVMQGFEHANLSLGFAKPSLMSFTPKHHCRPLSWTSDCTDVFFVGKDGRLLGEPQIKSGYGNITPSKSATGGNSQDYGDEIPRSFGQSIEQFLEHAPSVILKNCRAICIRESMQDPGRAHGTSDISYVSKYSFHVLPPGTDLREWFTENRTDESQLLDQASFSLKSRRAVMRT